MINKTEISVQLHKQRELLLNTVIQSGRSAFLAAASGLVCCDQHFFVVADDELHLGIFSIDHSIPGNAWPLLAGELSPDEKLRKRQKPDFEVLTYLPATTALNTPSLLILGSGSHANRNAGLLLSLNADNTLLKSTPPLIFDLTPLYRELESEFGIVNIEGAAVQRNHLLLLQRGNKTQGINALIALELIASVNAMLSGTLESSVLRSIRKIDLGSRAGVALGFTDAMCLPDGQLLALAVAEDTDDPYADGKTCGSYVCRFDANNQLQSIISLIAPAKTEGIALWQPSFSTKNCMLAFVTDADDPHIPSALLTAPLDAFI